MDVDYIYNSIDRLHQIELSGEHIALAAFLNSEFKAKRHQTEKLQSFVDAIELGQKHFEFTEWVVEIDSEEVLIKHISLFQDSNDNHDDYNVMAWELQSECGYFDLLALLVGWLDFIQET